MRIFKKIALILFTLLALVCIGGTAFLEFYTPALPQNHGKLDMELFLGDSTNQPLLVGFGGGEGGNAWASDYWKETREKFLEEGYAFLAIGYFGQENTAEHLDRIPLEGIYDSIMKVAELPALRKDKIALIGGSKGAELILNLASRYKEFSSVVAIVPGHASFPALSPMANTSSWTYLGEEVPFVPATYGAVPAMMNGDLLEAFSIMLEDESAVKAARIEVEKIEGSILFLSAKEDEMWPSTEMSNHMMESLKAADFQYEYAHIAFEGGHTEPLNHLDLVFTFLAEHFR